MKDYEKQRIALRYWLQGRGFTAALEALDFAETHHTGLRKDGVTPEIAHPIQVAAFVRTQILSLRHPQETLCAALLHDVREDHGVGDGEIRDRWGDLVADSVDCVTKEFRGQRRDDVVLFERIGANPIASVVKPADRINNQHSMIGVFGPEKVAAYMGETRQLFLPMIKRARRLYPDQELAYENSKLVLTTQLTMLDALLAAWM